MSGRPRCSWLKSLLVAGLAACSNAPTPDTPRACTPAMQSPCVCAGTAQAFGVQACEASGASSGACSCAIAPSSPGPGPVDSGTPGDGGDDSDQLLGSGYLANPDDLGAGGPRSCTGSATPIHLGVPWLPQVPPGSWAKTLNCWPAALAMAEFFVLGGPPPTSTTIRELDDELAEAFRWNVNNYNGSATSIHQLAAVACAHGLAGEAFRGGCDDLKSELAAGRPVLVVVDTQRYNGFPSTTMKSEKPHFMVVVGIYHEHVYVHDPGRSAPLHGCGGPDSASCPGYQREFDAKLAGRLRRAQGPGRALVDVLDAVALASRFGVSTACISRPASSRSSRSTGCGAATTARGSTCGRAARRRRHHHRCHHRRRRASAGMGRATPRAGSRPQPAPSTAAPPPTRARPTAPATAPATAEPAFARVPPATPASTAPARPRPAARPSWGAPARVHRPTRRASARPPGHDVIASTGVLLTTDAANGPRLTVDYTCAKPAKGGPTGGRSR